MSATEAVDVKRVRAYIGGWTDSSADGDIEVHDPADSRRLVATAPSIDRAGAGAAIELAAANRAEWAATSPLVRGQILGRAAELLAARADEVATGMTSEMGKVISESRGEVDRAVEILRFFAQEPKHRSGETYPLGSERESAFSLRLPHGAVGLITPWNFPLAIPTWKTAGALAFGNTVVLKPAAQAPLSSAALVASLIDAGLPEGVLSFVPGPGSVIGEAIVGSELIAAVSFTGSTEVGLSIAKRMAARGRPVQCEMGGRNAIVVLADADLDAATAAIVAAGFGTSGQRCTSSSRAIVERSVAGEMLDRLVAAARELRIGPGLEPESQLGPVVDASQREEILESIERGRSEGVEVVYGGSRPSGERFEHGHFIEPTVTRGPGDGWFAGHEIFGPVVSLIEAEDFDDAVRINNSVEYGLSSGIFTSSLTAAMRFVRETDTGMVHVNRPTTGAEPHIPFGGSKRSSVGPREMGGAWEFFTRSRSAHLRW